MSLTSKSQATSSHHSSCQRNHDIPDDIKGEAKIVAHKQGNTAPTTIPDRKSLSFPILPGTLRLDPCLLRTTSKFQQLRIT